MSIILSVSYDGKLLIARHRLLERAGYTVSSALGLKEAIAVCKSAPIDLLILGHTIPDGDKKTLIEALNKCSAASVLSIWHHDRQLVDGINYVVFSDNSDELLRSVAAILAKDATALA
jgi:DNA-binding response OmpR family regulator